jgi:alkylation response protein AidB-like acyl-CoA dehydrogenase
MTATTKTVLSDEERETFAAAARKLAEDKVGPRALEIGNTHDYPEDLFELLRDAGYFGLWVDPEWGGLGLDLWTVCRVIEELAHVSNSFASIVIGQLQGTLPILITGSDEIKARYVPDLVAGNIRPAMALTEPDAGSDVAGIRTIARRDGDHYVLDGRKAFITGASLADVITIYTKVEPGRSTSTIQGFVVPADTPGLIVGRTEEKMGSTALPTSEVILEGCRVPAELALGAPGEGFRSAMQVLEHVRPMIAARAVGLAQGALDAAIDHLREREAFGAPLAALQGLQFKVADMATAIEAARGLVHRACRALDEGDPDATRYCAMAKCFATDTAMSVTVDAVQLFGGYGVMKDYPVEHRMREAKVSQIVDGTNEVQRVVIARNLLGSSARRRS